MTVLYANWGELAIRPAVGEVAKVAYELKARSLAISNGYDDLKGETFRVAHMGDVTDGEMREVLDAMSEFMGN